MLTSKIIPEIIENHSEVSGFANNCNKFDLGKLWNYAWYFYKKVPPPPLSPLWKGRGKCTRFLASLG